MSTARYESVILQASNQIAELTEQIAAERAALEPGTSTACGCKR